jgi:hypothetical protein
MPTPVARSTPDAAVSQLITAQVGLSVPIIRPLSYETRFWSSELFQAAAEGHDTLHLFMRLASECLHLFRVQAGLPADIARPFHTLTCKATALVIVHIVFKIATPAFYWDARWITILHFRSGPHRLPVSSLGLLFKSRPTLALLCSLGQLLSSSPATAGCCSF